MAPLGTGATIVVALQLVGVAAVPLKVTLLDPWLDPKFVPAMATEVPTGPEFGERLTRVGAGRVTVKLIPLLAWPPTVTTTLPVVAPPGTGAEIRVALQLVGVAEVPLKVTVLDPWLDPKFAPLMVTEVPTGPEVGDRPLIVGAGTETAKLAPLLASPPTVTTTFPVVAPLGTLTAMLVALQAVAVPAEVPLNVTVLFPWLAPKFEPEIVTAVPTAPEVGLRLPMLGAGVVVVLPPLPPPQPATAISQQKSATRAKRRPSTDRRKEKSRNSRSVGTMASPDADAAAARISRVGGHFVGV
jgi:hypothetical protein